MAPDGSGRPFIMPDGRPLNAFLDADGKRAGADASRRRGSAKAKRRGSRQQQHWERTFRGTTALSAAPASEADQIELEVLLL